MMALVLHSIKAILPFFIFLLVWVIAFAYMLDMMGSLYQDDDYDGLGYVPLMILQTFRNSLGDIGVPELQFWKKLGSLDEVKSKKKLAD